MPAPGTLPTFKTTTLSLLAEYYLENLPAWRWLGGNFQQKPGNTMIMRIAEVYLFAAEATLKSSGDGATAAKYLNELRKRACRNIADFNAGTGMQLTSATMNDVFDEYARELCGEYNR